ncbi:MAG TPA: AAA family ATPase [Candidatus Anammoximicrobium sp.]|nr:AAA family ATPase [Candidatus Anammoximicrobium sp.]
MSLSQRLAEFISACFTGLWVQSHEHDDALAEIAQMCRDQEWRLAIWDVERGLHLPGQANGQAADAGGNDPLAAIRSLNAMASADSSAILVMVNAHRFMQSAEVVQALAQQISAGKQSRTFIVVLSPLVQVPIELEKLMVVVEHELPDRVQLEQIARGIATEDGELPDDDRLGTVLDAAAGLTRFEAEGAFSLSLVRHGQVAADSIWELKSQTLKKSGLLQLYRGNERFETLGGLQAMKAFCLRSMHRQGHSNPLKRPKGVLLLSPPGCGKSKFCQCLGSEVGRPTLILDIGALMGSLVGSTESNIRQALKIIDAMSPCVVMVDEVEKALAGVASSGQTDSGVTARLFGTFLTWLNDRTSDSYVICTCNDISKLPPEFSRSERFDGIWFLDLPGQEQRNAIWDIYLKMFELDPHQPRPKDDQWTGAEVRACCRLAALLDVPLTAAAQNVVPVAVTAAESVERLRTWAGGRCLDADRGGIYQGNGAKSTGRRKVSRNPLNN